MSWGWHVRPTPEGHGLLSSQAVEQKLTELTELVGTVRQSPPKKRPPGAMSWAHWASAAQLVP